MQILKKLQSAYPRCHVEQVGQTIILQSGKAQMKFTPREAANLIRQLEMVRTK